ncbi:neuroguidin-like [Varroa destructor]|uniref:Neuroguidin n=1 Tax=Varroa destructor TaxID=109461 RepID=A0A7M7J3F3_VARDE|nr:neuroguidin-like [Varroa destructor]
MAVRDNVHVPSDVNGKTEENQNVIQLQKIFSELRDRTGAFCQMLESLQLDISGRETKDGLSWLELKNHMLLSYLIDINDVVQSKLKGKSIAESPSIRRLIEYRTVLERMRPIDQKLKYQLQKMQKIAATGKVDKNDPLRFRANPDAFEFDNNINSGNDQEAAKDEKKTNDATKNGTSRSKSGSPGAASVNRAKPSTGVYVPPKLTPLQYLEDETHEARRDRQTTQAKRRALSSSLIAELQREFHEGPMEVREEYNPHKERLNKLKRERERYEEDNFVRLQVSKQERHADRLQGFAALDDITEFGGQGDPDFVDQGPSKKRRKASSKKYKKKWGQKGFRGKKK